MHFVYTVFIVHLSYVRYWSGIQSISQSVKTHLYIAIYRSRVTGDKLPYISNVVTWQLAPSLKFWPIKNFVIAGNFEALSVTS